MLNSMQHRPLSAIAAEIKRDWKTRLNGAAIPYIEALSELRDARDRWYLETGSDAIQGFLNNAQTWRGEVARRIKLELKAILKGSPSGALRASSGSRLDLDLNLALERQGRRCPSGTRP